MESDFRPIATKASRVQSTADQDAEFTVVVHTRKPRKVKPTDGVSSKSNSASASSSSGTASTFDIKRARHEVIRFGSSGFAEKEKKKAQIALAVKLGAKPPKREARSYKDILADRKATAAEAKDTTVRPLGHVFPNQLLVTTGQHRKRKRRDDQDTIRDYGKVDAKSLKK